MTKLWSFALLVLFLSVTNDLVADDAKPGASDREQVVKFLKSHVIDKTVHTPKSMQKLDNNTMESETEDQITFTNFTESAQGFSFDSTMIDKATRYDLDKDGKRKLPGRDLSGTEVYRFEIVERMSTKKLIGTMRLLSMTTKSSSREGATILLTGIKVVDSKLQWNETLPGYLDLIAAGGKYKPGSWDATNAMSVENGKLKFRTDYTLYDVDPDTLKRTQRTDKLSPFISTEIDQK
jgi:hypothetical protein